MSAFSWQVAALLVSIVAVVVSIGTFVRAGRWRDTDEGVRTVREIEDLKARMTRVEARLEGVARKEDIAALGGRIDGMGALVQRTDDAVTRIEQYLIGRPA